MQPAQDLCTNPFEDIKVEESGWSRVSGSWVQGLAPGLGTPQAVRLGLSCHGHLVTVTFLCLFCFGPFETESKIALAGFYFPTVGITGPCHHTWPSCDLGLFVAQLKESL